MLAVGRKMQKKTNFETKTVGVGVSVELTCPRKSSGSLFWIRIDSGDFPGVLRKTCSLKSNDRITATEERELFVLHIKEAKLSDAAVYYCIQISHQNLIFLTQTDLRVEEPEITAVSPKDPVRPGDSVTLQCSILSDSENKKQPEEQNLCCFKVASHQSRTSLNNT
ncbi:hypothetical protein NQZ68_042215 [Dissostichus eleginoides]|nr:hypothetical protein NQZ68_042215 [Dissostichus eleginoides]